MGFNVSGLIPKFFEPNPQSQVWNRNFSLDSSRNYLIHAASGKGKSSFFKMLTGINKDYTGEIFFDDINIKNSGPDIISELRLNNWSLVFQNLGLFNDLCLSENIEVTGDFQDCIENLKLLGLDQKQDQKTIQLSYGERQRLAIVKALNKNYDFLIMDEPFSHLDNKLKKIALEMILKDVQSKNASLVILDLEDISLFNNFQKLVL